MNVKYRPNLIINYQILTKFNQIKSGLPIYDLSIKLRYILRKSSFHRSVFFYTSV